jgi:hypothetical protein
VIQEIGVWTTDQGTTEARLELGSDMPGVTATELPSWVSDALKGAVAGASTGAAAGPYGALVGAVAGGALGAASSTAAPAPSASAPPSGQKQPADAGRAQIVQALQQFAAIVPALVQLAAASGKGGKESSTAEVSNGQESVDGSDWGPEVFQQGTWRIP